MYPSSNLSIHLPSPPCASDAIVQLVLFVLTSSAWLICEFEQFHNCSDQRHGAYDKGSDVTAKV